MRKIISNLIKLTFVIVFLIILNLIIYNKKNFKIESFESKKEDYSIIENENTLNGKYKSLKRDLDKTVGNKKININESIINIIDEYERNKDGTILSLEYINSEYNQNKVRRDDIKIIAYGSLDKISTLSKEIDNVLKNSKVTKVIVDNLGTTFRGEIDIVSYE